VVGIGKKHMEIEGLCEGNLENERLKNLRAHTALRETLGKSEDGAWLAVLPDWGVARDSDSGMEQLPL
jgi:hypothetical protein